MKEVSCKVFTILFPALEKKGVALDGLVTGTKVSVEMVKDRKERIDWGDYVAIMKRVRPHFTDEEYVELGRAWMRSPGIKFAFVIARMLFSPMDFYRWMNKPREGVGNQMFSCVVPKHTELGPNHVQLELTLPEGFEVCWDFYVISSGNMEELPRLLGLPPSKVTLSRIHQGARFDIIVPLRTPFLARIWRAITWPFTARAAARELKEAHETLLDRFEEIEEARRKLDVQATRLRTAHAISDLIHGDLDLERTTETIAKALVEEANFVSAQLETLEPHHRAEFKTPTTDAPLVQEIHGQGKVIGTVRVWCAPEAKRSEGQELLAFLESTLAMAIQNANAYRELSEYKSGLEKLVDQRTLELRGARDELSVLVDQLRDAQAAREKFFANISHEIRTPLSLILLAAGDVERRSGTALDQRAREDLSAVTDSARKLLRLVDELLLLAAGQVEKLTMSIEPTDVAALLQQIALAWRPAAEAAGLQLECKTPASLVLEVDPTAIERVASNLVSNAVKYTPRGGRVDLELELGAQIRLSVLDTGRGIDADLASRLFGRFERAAGDDRRQSGTGIGLALVKQLVEAHGGMVAAQPRAGAGTEFRVLLPASLVSTGKPAAPTYLRTSHAPGAVTTIRSGDVLAPAGVSLGTILITEDEPRLAESIARLLCEQYMVVIALDGATAIDLIKKHQPQLLITDVDMPGMTGIELAKRFRETTGDRLAPIIILSAVMDLGTRLAGLEAGAVDYVGKPFEPKELLARVEAQFRMRELALRLHRAEQVSSLGILTTGLAHELRNPANGVVNSLDPLRELLPPELTTPDSDIGQLLEAIKTGSDQILFLVNQLLGFHHSSHLELRPVKIDDLVKRAGRLANGSLRDIELKLDLAAEGTLMCAAPLMIQVLTNLIENGAHAAGAGGWVSVRSQIHKEQLAIEVSDSGPGVPNELRERIFEPFFTTKAPGVGTGLGLSVARTIIHRHRGTLSLRQRGHHTAFVIELPLNTNLVQPVIAL